MSEFDAFESAAGAEGEQDPAAEFLAREQDQLAALEDDNFASGQDVAQGGASESAGDEFGGSAPADVSGGLFETGTTDLDGTPVASEPTEASLFASAPTDTDQQAVDPQTGISDLADDGLGTQSSSDAYAAISQVDMLRQEPEKIRLWREEQKERLTVKDEESEKKKGEWREVAKKELEDWYRHRNEQLEKTKANNREAEAVFVQDRDESTPGHEWEKIYRLCEFNAKQARNTKDISRMRSILLQLKQTPLVR